MHFYASKRQNSALISKHTLNLLPELRNPLLLNNHKSDKTDIIAAIKTSKPRKIIPERVYYTLSNYNTCCTVYCFVIMIFKIGKV